MVVLPGTIYPQHRRTPRWELQTSWASGWVKIQINKSKWFSRVFFSMKWNSVCRGGATTVHCDKKREHVLYICHPGACLTHEMPANQRRAELSRVCGWSEETHLTAHKSPKVNQLNNYIIELGSPCFYFMLHARCMLGSKGSNCQDLSNVCQKEAWFLEMKSK